MDSNLTPDEWDRIRAFARAADCRQRPEILLPEETIKSD